LFALDVLKTFFGTGGATIQASTTTDTELEAGNNIMNLLLYARLCEVLHRMHRYEDTEAYLAEFYHLYLKMAPTETRFTFPLFDVEWCAVLQCVVD